MIAHCGDENEHGPHDWDNLTGHFHCVGTAYGDPWSLPLFSRDHTPDQICLCGHSQTAHRIDLKTKKACDRGGCGCLNFRHVLNRFREWRYVDVPIPLVPVDGPDAA